MAWTTKKIGELADINRGSSPRPITDTKYSEGGTIPWVKIADATRSGKFLRDTAEYVNEYGASFSRYLPEGTILVAASGVTLGFTTILGIKGCAHDGWLILQNLRGLDRDYAYYFLKTIGQQFHNSSSGAAIQNINTDILRQTEIPLPPLPVQRRVAGILSAYDELMENSQWRIRILEAMARALYREWFVHFKFPGHEKIKPVNSPLGKIPAGWEVKKLGDLISYNRRATKHGSHLDERRYVPIDCLPSKSLALLEAKPIEEAQSSLQLFDKGDILFGAMRPYFHKVAIAPFDGVTRTTCFVFKPAQPEWSAFATMTAFEEATVAYANAHSQGATIPYAVWDGSLSGMLLLLPPDALLRRFEKIVAPMLARIAQSYFTLNNLRRTRDLLLPRLLSGQVELKT